MGREKFAGKFLLNPQGAYSDVPKRRGAHGKAPRIFEGRKDQLGGVPKETVAVPPLYPVHHVPGRIAHPPERTPDSSVLGLGAARVIFALDTIRCPSPRAAPAPPAHPVHKWGRDLSLNATRGLSSEDYKYASPLLNIGRNETHL